MTFKYDIQKILSQFYLDVPREELYLNDYLFQNPSLAYNTIDNTTLTTQEKNIIYLMGTQVSMALPCDIIIKLYCLGQKKFLSETRDQKTMKIRVKTEPYLSIEIEKTMRIFRFIDEVDNNVNILDMRVSYRSNESKYMALSWRLR